MSRTGNVQNGHHSPSVDWLQHGSWLQAPGAGLISPSGTTGSEMAEWTSGRNAETTSKATWRPSLEKPDS